MTRSLLLLLVAASCADSAGSAFQVNLDDGVLTISSETMPVPKMYDPAVVEVKTRASASGWESVALLFDTDTLAATEGVGETFLRVEPLLPVDQPERDMGLVIQTRTGERAWHTVTPPPGYHFYSVTGIYVDPDQSALMLRGEVCRHDAGDAGLERHCQYVRRWTRGADFALRLTPYPMGTAKDVTTAYAVELVSSETR